jgi:hypothetical protein
MSRDKLLPAEQLASVVTLLYREAERLGWDTLPPQDRSRIYSRWVEDERVGGILGRYMTPEAARSWIKDGPMKEYSRARRGTGRYARFGREGGTTTIDVVHVALGSEATVVPGSEGVKPFHCFATRGDSQVYVTWGEARNFRNLLWAALQAALQGTDAHIVVMEQPDRITPSAETQSHRALATRCGLTVHHMREQLGRATRGGAR